MAKRKTVVDFVTLLAEVFYRECKDATFDLYCHVLADVPENLVVAAFNAALISNRQFMPTPGQIRELAVTGGVGYMARAERAWIEFDRAVGIHGADRSVSFADGLINATVRLLGDWIFCCGRVGEDYSVWLRKQFLETYQRLCATGASESMRQPLMGNLWKENVIFPDTILDKLAADTGQVQAVVTSQPVLLPPAEAPKRIEQRPANLPQLELKAVNR